jgi:Ca2+-binding EF-hand superfamily protein
MSYKLKKIGVFLACLSVAGLASAQDGKESTPFDRADQNGDGKVSFEEYRNRAAFLFHDYDHNDDQHLTADELPEYRNAKGVIVATQSITIEDYMASVAHSFDMGDTNKDGFLEASEWGVAPSMNK